MKTWNSKDLCLPALRIEVNDDHGNYFAYPWCGNIRIGHLNAVRQAPDKILLGDIRIKDSSMIRRRSWLERLFSDPFRSFDPVSFRNEGIGTRLLNGFLGWCLSNGVSEVYGSVIADDIQNTPKLLDWYQARGFRVEAPNAECLPIAVRMVVWNPPR